MPAPAALNLPPSSSTIRPRPRNPHPTDPPPQKYTPYKFDSLPLTATLSTESSNAFPAEFDQGVSLSFMSHSTASTSHHSDLSGAAPLLRAALESMGDMGEGGSDQGGSNAESLSPRSGSARATPSSAATDSSGNASEGDKQGGQSNMNSASSSYGYQNHPSVYSHPAYNTVQHPLYARPLSASQGYPSSAYSLPPLNRPNYTPYNYQSPYSRPLSSSGPGSGQGAPSSFGAGVTLPPISLNSFNGSDPSSSLPSQYRQHPNVGPPNGTAFPSQAPPSFNPYNHPAYAAATQHTYQHPAYGRASISSQPGSIQQQQQQQQYPPMPPLSTNPYSHPALPPPGVASNSLSAPNSPWSGPPPPPLSLSSGGSLLAKRRRSETTGSIGLGMSGGGEGGGGGGGVYGSNGLTRSASDQMEDHDELDELEGQDEEGGEGEEVVDAEGEEDARTETREERDEREQREEDATVASEGSESTVGPKGTNRRPSRRNRRTRDQAVFRDDVHGGEGDDDENDDGDSDLAPQVPIGRPTKRARTSTAASSSKALEDAEYVAPTKSTTTTKTIRPKPGTSGPKAPVVRAKPTPKPAVEKSKEPPEKKFVCPHPSCGRAFARHFNLNSHIKSHQGIREFKCPECNKLFSRKHDCTRHCIAIHHYDKDSGVAPVYQPQKLLRTDPPTAVNLRSPPPSTVPTETSSSSSSDPKPSTSTTTTTKSKQPGGMMSIPLAPTETFLHANASNGQSSSSNHQPARQSLAMLLQSSSSNNTESTAMSNGTSIDSTTTTKE